MIAVGIHCPSSQSRQAGGSSVGRRLAFGIPEFIGGFRIGTVQPARLQLLTVEVDSPDIGIGIIAATEDTAGTLVRTAQIGCCCQIAFTTIAVIAFVVLAAAVVPVEGACSLAQLCLGITVGPVGNGVNGCTRLTVKDRQVFVTAIDATSTCAMILRVVGGLDKPR